MFFISECLPENVNPFQNPPLLKHTEKYKKRRIMCCHVYEHFERKGGVLPLKCLILTCSQ